MLHLLCQLSFFRSQKLAINNIQARHEQTTKTIDFQDSHYHDTNVATHTATRGVLFPLLALQTTALRQHLQRTEPRHFGHRKLQRWLVSKGKHQGMHE